MNDAAGFAPHLELGRKVQLHRRLIACLRCKFDVLKNLTPFTSLSLAIRTPIEMHRILVPVSLIVTPEV
jgi:hypothetical protein